ncbi:MAG: YidC/Oxa1 family membrane protein insertase [Clostridia bacterium]|nr:YidC/Oxa1 family membrane protein insertase [Clostridia bacterium]
MNIIFNTLYNLLNQVFSFTGDWGIAIIILTFAVRAVLLPLSLMQKRSVEKQQNLSKKFEELKEKFKDDKPQLDTEMARYSSEGAKNMLGCSVTLLQLPIMYTLYNVFLKMPSEIGTIVIPWISSLKLPDTYFILPLLSVLVQVAPNILTSLGMLNSATAPKVSRVQVLIISAMNFLIFFKAPISLGIYWVTSGIFSALELIAYNLYRNRRCLNKASA